MATSSWNNHGTVLVTMISLVKVTVPINIIIGNCHGKGNRNIDGNRRRDMHSASDSVSGIRGSNGNSKGNGNTNGNGNSDIDDSDILEMVIII